MNSRAFLQSTRDGALISLYRKVVRRMRPGSTAEPTDYQALHSIPASLDAEYKNLIAENLQRWGVPERCATVAVQQLARNKRDRDVFVGIVTLSKWDRDVAIRLMLGLPLLEKKIRKVLQVSWIGEVSDFEGLWLHTSDELLGSKATTELRHLAASLTGGHNGAPRHAAGGPESTPGAERN